MGGGGAGGKGRERASRQPGQGIIRGGCGSRRRPTRVVGGEVGALEAHDVRSAAAQGSLDRGTVSSRHRWNQQAYRATKLEGKSQSVTFHFGPPCRSWRGIILLRQD